MAGKTKDEKLANKWQQRFENREDALKNLHGSAQKNFDIMYAVQNTKKISPWKSKVYLPILASKAWDLIAKMSDVVPYFNVTVKNELEMSEDTGQFQIPESTSMRQKRIEAKLHHDYLCSEDEPMKLKVFDPLVDAVVAGTGFAYAPWVYENKTSYARKYDALGNMDNTNIIKKTEGRGRNEFEGINFFDVFPAKARRWNKMPYLIVRGVKPLLEMEMADGYVNLDKVDTTYKQDTRDEYNVSRNRVVNESESTDRDDTVDEVTYYECYERTTKGIQLTVFAEGESVGDDDGSWVMIKKPSVPYWHNTYPIVPFYLRKKSYSIFGEPLFENNRTLQSATNDLFNHYLDNWNLSIESMLMYEDGTLTNDFVIEPGGEITFTGEPPKQFKFPEPNPQQLSAVLDVIEKGVEQATFSNYASGNANSSTDKTQGTAYGVKTIAEAATSKIGFFRDNFKQSMKMVGRIWLSNLQQFADTPEEIMRPDSGKMVPDIVMPSDYQGEVELDIDDDSMYPMSKVEKREAHQAFLADLKLTQELAITQAGIFKQPADIPRYNFHEINQDTAELYSKRDFERYVLDSNVEIPQPPVDDTKEYVNMNYKDAPPDIKAQIEQKMGLEPSSIHDNMLMGMAIEEGAKEGQLLNPGGMLNEPQTTNATGTPSPAK